jgi:5-methylcytosine-specific restriction endonuclease McrA
MKSQQIRFKRPRVKLESEAYRQLCHEVLERDGWRCQSCGSIEGLQIHHIQPRSRLGDDSAENLMALCVRCHQKAHGHGYVVRNSDGSSWK